MIGRFPGKLLSHSPGRLLIDVAGVGYEVRIPLSTFYTLTGGVGADVSLHVHTHVREDALELFAFASGAERAVFEQLIAISGVGPRMALAILSGIGVKELYETVQGRDRTRLERIPGVGKKTAERLLLELQDRLPEEVPATGPEGAAAKATGTGLRPDAISALVNLGYSRDVAGRVVDRTLERTDPPGSLESLLRAALAGLVR
jgi:Holliday junction DNA helicase RuvA